MNYCLDLLRICCCMMIEQTIVRTMMRMMTIVLDSLKLQMMKDLPS